MSDPQAVPATPAAAQATPAASPVAPAVTSTGPAPLSPVVAAALGAPIGGAIWTPDQPVLVAPAAPVAPAGLSPEAVAELVKAAIAQALAAQPAPKAKSLLDISWVPDVKTALSWAETRVAIAAVAICGLVPTVMSIWTGAPPEVHEFVQHYLPTGAAAGVATALFVLQSLATLMNFKAGAKANQ